MSAVLHFYLMSSGAMVTVSIITAILLCSRMGRRQHVELKVWVCTTAILAAIHEYYLFLFFNGESLDTMVVAAKYLNITALWLMPSVVLLITRLTGYLYSSLAIVITLLFCLSLSIYEVYSAVPIPFTHMPDIKLITTFWGETIPILAGPTSLFGDIRNLALILCQVWYFSSMLMYVRKNNDVRSKFFIGYMTLSSLLFFHDILVVFGVIHSVFISLLGVLVLICYFSLRTLFEHNSMQVKLAKLAFKDLQTGLPNRAHMLEFLEAERAHFREETSIAFWIVDIDHFSRYNKTFGRNVGNQILHQIANQLRCVAKTYHIKLAKLDMDQFLLVSSRQQNNDRFLQQVASAAQRAAQQEIFIDERYFKPTCTIGMAVFGSEEIFDAEELFRFAEQAIVHAKQLSKSNIVKLDEADLHRSRYEQSLMKSLQDALDNCLLQAFFQPQVSASGKLYGAEVLVRWQGERGFIPPSDFIPLAEKYGLIHKLGTQILEKSLAAIQMYQHQLLNQGFRLSVNVSSWELGRPGYVSDILTLFKTYDVSPALYTLEVTESAMMHDIDDSKDKLLELKRHGFRIALDDFGTGYSSLSYLTMLPLDILKIDKAFVNRMDRQSDVMFVKGIHDISRSCKLITLAEGVESEEQINALKAMGVEYFQGYYFSRPLPFKEFERSYLVASCEAMRK